ncbi:MAG: hypothetical protein Q7R44_00835, partial [bacterium]|nr:hypothetical protein [bacterium]
LLNEGAKKNILGTPLVSPDLVILLDVDPEEGHRRTQTAGREITHFDRDAIEVQKLRAEAYKELAAQGGWVVIDANKTSVEVFQNILLTLISKGIINQVQIDQFVNQDLKEK